MSSSIDERAVSHDWTPFSKKLALILAKLREDQYLILSANNGHRFLQFACQGATGMRAEVVSNHFLEGKDRLNRRQISWLRAHGWNAPTGNFKQATAKKDPHGSPNFYIDFPAPIDNRAIAHQSAEALVYGLAIPHPTRLLYKAFAANGTSLTIEGLPIEPDILQGSRLMEQVLTVLREATGLSDLQLDGDGDISFSFGQLSLYATAKENKLRLISVMVTDVIESSAVLSLLNRLNLGRHSVRCVIDKNRIFGSFDIPTSPFIPELVAAGLDEFARASEALALELHGELSSRGFIQPAVTLNLIQ